MGSILMDLDTTVFFFGIISFYQLSVFKVALVTSTLGGLGSAGASKERKKSPALGAMLSVPSVVLPRRFSLPVVMMFFQLFDLMSTTFFL